MLIWRTRKKKVSFLELSYMVEVAGCLNPYYSVPFTAPNEEFSVLDPGELIFHFSCLCFHLPEQPLILCSQVFIDENL